MDIDEYLEYVGRFRQSSFGRRFRGQFHDLQGTAELAMLAAPSEAEFNDFRRAVEAMTAEEKNNPAALNDEQVRAIANRAGAEIANVSIFINGFILAHKKSNLCRHKNLRRNN